MKHSSRIELCSTKNSYVLGVVSKEDPHSLMAGLKRHMKRLMKSYENSKAYVNDLKKWWRKGIYYIYNIYILSSRVECLFLQYIKSIFSKSNRKCLRQLCQTNQASLNDEYSLFSLESSHPFHLGIWDGWESVVDRTYNYQIKELLNWKRKSQQRGWNHRKLR